MNNTQPEALRLAEAEEKAALAAGASGSLIADELRRLHDVEQEAQAMRNVGWELLQNRNEWCDKAIKLQALNKELLGVLNKLEYSSDGYIKRYPDESEVRAAIAKAQGE